MKRILFLTFAVALSFSVYAQTSVFQRNLKTTSNAHLSISQSHREQVQIKCQSGRLNHLQIRYGGVISQKTKNVMP